MPARYRFEISLDAQNFEQEPETWRRITDLLGDDVNFDNPNLYATRHLDDDIRAICTELRKILGERFKGLKGIQDVK